MEIRIRYKDGHLDLFDTSTFTKSEPFAGTNMLTEFVIDTEDVEESGFSFRPIPTMPSSKKPMPQPSP